MMKPILVVLLMTILFDSSAQDSQLKTNNNVLSLKYPDGTYIPDGTDHFYERSHPDSCRLLFLINHRSTLSYLLKVKRKCKRMGLFLNFRALVFDQGQQLIAIKVDYALQRGSVMIAVASELGDSTRFGVFGSISLDSYRYYVGYEKRE